MKQILIIEDQSEKRKAIIQFLDIHFPGFFYREASSLRGAILEISKDIAYDVILLDMTMPDFDSLSDKDDQIQTEIFAGKDFLEQMKLRLINVPVVLITQYSSFEGGRVTLEEIDEDFRIDYRNNYKGYVYYNSANDSWKEDLLEILKEVL